MAMDTGKMREIRRNITELSVLEERAQKKDEELEEAEGSEEELKNRFLKESCDVEKLKHESFTVMLLQHIGRYEGKLTKENAEMLSAKLEYDKACDNLKKLRVEQEALTERINALKRDEQDYETELRKRKEQIESYLTVDAYAQYKEVAGRLKAAERQRIETQEAIRAAKKASSTAQKAADCLEGAQGWATYDAFTRGGFFSHTVKYDRVDEAKSYINMLESQLSDLKRELSDINLSFDTETVEIDSFNRAVDFWFDNIFTDLNVRSIICDNKEQMTKLCEKLNKTIEMLEERMAKIEKNISEFEKREEELIVG